MTGTSQKSPARKPRGEYAKTKATRLAILDAALEVFAESGYRAGSIREVAVRVGMSEAGLLHHFPSKFALLEAVLDRRDARALDFVRTDSGDGAVVLRGLVRLAAHNATIPGVVELYCILSAEATSPEHPAHDYFMARYAFTRTTLENAFGSLADENRLHPGMTPRGAAVALIAMMDGLQVQWLFERGDIDMADELRTLFDQFVDIDWTLEDDQREI